MLLESIEELIQLVLPVYWFTYEIFRIFSAIHLTLSIFAQTNQTTPTTQWRQKQRTTSSSGTTTWSMAVLPTKPSGRAIAWPPPVWTPSRPCASGRMSRPPTAPGSSMPRTARSWAVWTTSCVWTTRWLRRAAPSGMPSSLMPSAQKRPRRSGPLNFARWLVTSLWIRKHGKYAIEKDGCYFGIYVLTNLRIFFLHV